MSQAPSMPMYWDAYLADTTHLEIHEHGAYLLLLAAMWRRNGFIPDDDKDNARILGISKAKWLKIKARLEPFLEYENDEITQKKLQETWSKTQEKITRNRENGAKGGRPKINKNNDLLKANGLTSDNPNKTIPEPEPKPLNRVTKVTPVSFEEFWNQYPHRGGAKKGKSGALKVYTRQLKAGISEQTMISGAIRYSGDAQVLDGRGKGPEPWLNQRCWEDEIETGGQNGTGFNNAQNGSGMLGAAMRSRASREDRHDIPEDRPEESDGWLLGFDD